MDIGEGDDEDDDIQAHDSSSSNNIRSFNKPTDEHNEVCEVCEIGGDLLCCETCTLVYHISCLRPKIMSIPKGHWSCVHCVIDVSRERLNDTIYTVTVVDTIQHVCAGSVPR